MSIIQSFRAMAVRTVSNQKESGRANRELRVIKKRFAQIDNNFDLVRDELISLRQRVFALENGGTSST